MKELKYWSGRFQWATGEDRDSWGQQHILVAAYTKKQAIDITGTSPSEITNYWNNTANEKDKAILGDKVGVAIIQERGSFENRGRILFQGDRIPGTVDAPVKEKVVGESNDTARTLWVTGSTGPLAFPVVGETPLKWKKPVSFSGTEKFTLVDKNPEILFLDWDLCLAACKKEAGRKWEFAQRRLEEATKDILVLDSIVKPEEVGFPE